MNGAFSSPSGSGQAAKLPVVTQGRDRSPSDSQTVRPDRPRYQKAGRKIFQHDLPPWVDPDASDFFITICCQRRGSNQLCLPGIGDALLASATFYADQCKWFPAVFLLMPDHVHLLAAFGHHHAMTQVVPAWKRYTARQHRIVWQQDYFEHRLRGNESFEEKAAYILNNPVRAGLMPEGAAWPYMLRMNFL